MYLIIFNGEVNLLRSVSINFQLGEKALIVATCTLPKRYHTSFEFVHIVTDDKLFKFKNVKLKKYETEINDPWTEIELIPLEMEQRKL